MPTLQENHLQKPKAIKEDDNIILNSLIALLFALFSKNKLKEDILTDDVIEILKDTQTDNAKSKEKINYKSSKKTLLQNIKDNKEVVETDILKAIYKKSTDFIIESQTDNQIIYSDPFDRKNPDKRIIYNFDAKTKKWKIIYGPDANAIIHDDKSDQIIFINSGKEKSRGEGNLEVDIDGTSNEHLRSLIAKKNIELIRCKLEGSALYAYNVPKDKENYAKYYLEYFSTKKCAKSRSSFIGQIMDRFAPSIYEFEPDSVLYQHSDGNCYSWLYNTQNPDDKIGIEYRKDGSIGIIVPKESPSSNKLIVFGYKNEADKGFDAGGNLLYIRNDGSFSSKRNSKAGHEHQEFLQKVKYISQGELESHLENARRAAGFSLQGKKFIADNILENSQNNTNEEQYSNTTNSQDKEVDINVTSLPSPKHIIVRSTNNAPTFELHCAFRQEVFTDDKGEPSGPTNEDFEYYNANIYIFKKVGTDIKDEDMSKVIIVEESDNGEIRFRSGYSGSNENKNIIEANITVNKDGKKYTAEIVSENNNAKHDFSKSGEGHPFRDNLLFKEFMCIDGCLGGIYDNDNKMFINNPSIVKGKNIRG